MQAPLRLLSEALQPALDLVYPPRCPSCGEAVADQTGLCLDCWSALEFPPEPACRACQRSVAADDQLCGACAAAPPRWHSLNAAVVYNDASRKLVLAFKHGGRIALAAMMARLMARRLPEGDALIVPVPLHRTRIWRRGYNQSALLAGELGKLSSRTVLPDVLLRTRRTRSLGGLTGKARARELEGAIALTRSGKRRIEGRSVVLIDDVLTSGATVAACVDALRKAGAGPVHVLCFARVAMGKGAETKTPGAIDPGRFA